MSARRGVVLIFAIMLFAVVVSIGGLVLLVAIGMTGGAAPTVPSNSTLYFSIDAPLPEIERFDAFSAFVPVQPTLRHTLDAIRRAKNDTRVKSIVIRPQVTGALWGQLQEVRAALEDFRSSGKPLTAYLESAGTQDYLIASAADRIVMMPAGQLDVSGLATYELFFRGTLDKVGVYPDLLHIGPYKTAANTFTERQFTPAHREMAEWLAKDWYSQLVRAVAGSRRRDEAEVRRALEGGPYRAEQALEAGLVDAVAYEDQLDDAGPIQGTRRLESNTYLRTVSSSSSGGSTRFALVYAVGTISSGKSDSGGTVVGSDTFAEWMRKIRLDGSIRAVILRVDSPGGSAIASEAMWRELHLTNAIKPVIVSMGDVAASGGYYIAAPATAIVAEGGTITGSIGVVTGKLVLQGALDKVGVGSGAVSVGPMAEIYSPFKPFSPQERERIEDQMQATYDLFVSRVAEGRKKTTAQIDAVAQGRVWTGSQARELGLVDELGGLETAVRLAKQHAKIDSARDVSFTVYPPRRSVYELLSDPLGRGSGLSVEIERWLSRPDARIFESAVSTLLRFRRGEPLTLMPNVFVQR
jgi:protease-4